MQPRSNTKKCDFYATNIEGRVLIDYLPTYFEGMLLRR